ncbi:hypothetical protein GCM10010446_02620 [Streptomyces enissocaesilis]|uniref:Uncharacterized protein n=1 Tax=Streptomyces enissocaesilis TaxID=332589 RepID=A0ABN3WNC6_9ACTN
MQKRFDLESHSTQRARREGGTKGYGTEPPGRTPVLSPHFLPCSARSWNSVFFTAWNVGFAGRTADRSMPPAGPGAPAPGGARYWRPCPPNDGAVTAAVTGRGSYNQSALPSVLFGDVPIDICR